MSQPDSVELLVRNIREIAARQRELGWDGDAEVQERWADAVEALFAAERERTKKAVLGVTDMLIAEREKRMREVAEELVRAADDITWNDGPAPAQLLEWAGKLLERDRTREETKAPRER